MPRPPPILVHKWPMIGAYWFVQAIVMSLVWPMVMLEWRPQLRLSDLPHGEDAWAIGVWVVAVTAMQAGFVLPVRQPARSTGARMLSACIASLAIAFAAALAAWMVAVCLAGMDVAIFEPKGSGIWYWPFWAGFAAGFASLPLCVRRFRRGVPILLSVGIAVLASGMVILALGCAAFSIATLAAGTEIDDHRFGISLTALLILLLSWATTTPILIAFARRNHPESALSRIANVLFLGTIIETAAIIPLDVMIRRKTSCYCSQGTFVALSFLGSVGFLAFGPAVYLLPLGRRRKRLEQGRCPICGYDLRSTPNAPKCPECGIGWKAE